MNLKSEDMTYDQLAYSLMIREILEVSTFNKQHKHKINKCYYYYYWVSMCIDRKMRWLRVKKKLSIEESISDAKNMGKMHIQACVMCDSKQKLSTSQKIYIKIGVEKNGTIKTNGKGGMGLGGSSRSSE